MGILSSPGTPVSLVFVSEGSSPSQDPGNGWTLSRQHRLDGLTSGETPESN